MIVHHHNLIKIPVYQTIAATRHQDLDHGLLRFEETIFATTSTHTVMNVEGTSKTIEAIVTVHPLRTEEDLVSPHLGLVDMVIVVDHHKAMTIQSLFKLSQTSSD